MNRIALCLCVLYSMAAAAQAPDITVKVPQPATFIIYGDTRFADPAERTYANPDVRQALVADIAAEHPAVVAITGDIVLKGTPSAWQDFHDETAAWRAEHITVLPALGNHDLVGEDALSHYFDQFPQIGKKRWYSARAANVLFLILDSDLPDTPDSEQGRWLEAQLSQVPKDVDFVLLVMHHPVYTHSVFSIFSGGHEARSSERQLGAMLEAKQKTLRPRILVFSGHVHNYERYEHGGVTYIVSGGGGAPMYPIRRAEGDVYTLPGPNFHYCRVRVNGPKILVEMVRLETNSSGYTTHVRDDFQLTAGPTAAAATAAR